MMEAVDTAGATPGGRAASWFPVAWTASRPRCRCASPPTTAAPFASVRACCRAATTRQHVGGARCAHRARRRQRLAGGDALGKPAAADFDEIRAEIAAFVAGLKSVYDGKSADFAAEPYARAAGVDRA